MQNPTCLHCGNVVPPEAVLCPSCGNWWKTDQSAGPSPEPAHTAGHGVRRSLNNMPGWVKALYVAVIVGTVGWVIGRPQGSTPAPYPPDSRVLAIDTVGGWINVDFLYQGDPVADAEQCVASRPREAVACYAFASHEDYSRAQPRGAGNFVHTCWDARASRDKTGRESSSKSVAKTSGCAESASVRFTTTSAAAPAQASQEPLLVSLDVDPELDGAGGLRIAGTTNLPDGTVLSFSVSAETLGFLAQSSGTVSGGAFESEQFSFRGNRFPPGRYEIGVTVPFYNAQPESVRRRLGSKLELMTGPLVRPMNEDEVELFGLVASVETLVGIR